MSRASAITALFQMLVAAGSDGPKTAAGLDKKPSALFDPADPAYGKTDVRRHVIRREQQFKILARG